MKKVLAFVLSLVLIFTLVAVAACDGSNDKIGGNKFKEVDLNDTAKRAEFVNSLAERADTEKLIGNPNQAGWSFGLEEMANSKFEFNVDVTPAGADKLTAKGNVEVTENVKASIKSNGAKAAPEFAASLVLGLKGNVELPETVYGLLDGLFEGTFMEEIGFATILQGLLTNFDYALGAYVDSDAALFELSEGLYGKLPEEVQQMLGSRKIMLPLGALSASTYASTTIGGFDGSMLQSGIIKAYIDSVLVEYLLQFKISVAVANNSRGYALRLTANKESVLAILDTALSYAQAADAAAIKEMVAKSISEAKFELTVRIDKDGAFSSIKTETALKLSLDLDIPEFAAIKGTVSTSGSVEISVFKGTISKPNAADYAIPAFMAE